MMLAAVELWTASSKAIQLFCEALQPVMKHRTVETHYDSIFEMGGGVEYLYTGATATIHFEYRDWARVRWIIDHLPDFRWEEDIGLLRVFYDGLETPELHPPADQQLFALA